MSIVDEFKSGQFSLYAQWMAIISLLLLVILGFTNFLGVTIFAVLGFIFAGFMFFLELPILTAWCPTGPKTERAVKFFGKPLFRMALYAVFSIVMWLSIMQATTSILIAAVSLSATTVLYGIAVFKKEELSRSEWTGGKGIARGASSPVKPPTSSVGRGANAV
ncbi:Golgi apparatus membrane protein tvp18 [Chytridiales sp. JEL 0842]|nr:Golgi apparatus membrane protein tvp18 [Chytridiales sp. JEL 0842]